MQLMMFYPVLAFGVAFIVLTLLLKTRLVTIALDQPNHRSMHTKVIPRTGGIAIMSGILAAWAAMNILLWLLPIMLLLAVSLIDDIRGLPAGRRLMAHLLVTAAFLMVILPEMPWGLAILMVLAITWMSNLYNFMDGSDGLAGGMAVFGFASYAIAAWIATDTSFALMNASVAAASLAFLLFNFYPARIFMGDGGSVPLGFLAGALGVYGWQLGVWPMWFPLLVFSPFIMDASITLLKRLLLGEKIWQAHRSHYYQRLIQMGWGHRKTACTEYLVMLGAGITALSLLNKPLGLIIGVLTAWALVYAFLMLGIDKRWARRLV